MKKKTLKIFFFLHSIDKRTREPNSKMKFVSSTMNRLLMLMIIRIINEEGAISGMWKKEEKKLIWFKYFYVELGWRNDAKEELIAFDKKWIIRVLNRFNAQKILN